MKSELGNSNIQKILWMHVTLLLTFVLISVALQAISDSTVFSICQDIQAWKIVETITSLKTACERSRTGAQYPALVVIMLFFWFLTNCALIYLIIKKIYRKRTDRYEADFQFEKTTWMTSFALIFLVIVSLVAVWAVLTTGANPDAFSGRARYLSNALLQPVFAALQMLILVFSSYVLFIPLVYFVGSLFKSLWRKV